MTKKTRNLTLCITALAAALLLAAAFSACDSPLGFGDAIDLEPPVLYFDPQPSNPYPVRAGTTLEGFIDDNRGIDRIVARDSNTKEVMTLFKATISGNKWTIVMDFDPNSTVLYQEISLEVVAYDKAGNSAEQSMATILILVDTGPPVLNNIQIYRTDLRIAQLEKTYAALEDLEKRPVDPITNPLGLGTDPWGELIENVNKYQNGVFTIKGKIEEEQTRIVGQPTLLIYDAREPNIPLYEKESEGRSPFSPEWKIDEEELLNAGAGANSPLLPNYKTAYYAGARYYYRVVIQAEDRSGNLIKENEGYFVMWETADEPKGVTDPPTASGVHINVQRGTPLIVDFFDDDQLLWAYTGLFTSEQWNGTKGLNSSDLRMMGSESGATGATDEQKLTWLKTQLETPSVTINNWRQDRYPSSVTAQDRITAQAGAVGVNNDTVYIDTGNSESDNGEYRLFVLVADKKLPPHPVPPPNLDTYKTRERRRVWTVNIIDENVPVIVFDTVDTTDPQYDPANHLGIDTIQGASTGNSPEENTFPILSAGGGTKFEINGYTLREDRSMINGVKYFRLAWIPYGIGGGKPDDYITAVQNALQDTNYPNVFNNSNSLEGVQHWDFVPQPRPFRIGPNGPIAADPPVTLRPDQEWLVNGTVQEISGGDFRKQVFRKQFDILGAADPKKPGYNHFTYNNLLENQTKLFIIYAEDNMGHVVFRQLRLLANKTPPQLTVFDLSGIVRDDKMPSGYPNVNASPYNGVITPQYDTALKTYNERADVYNVLKYDATNPSDSDKTIPWQTYPRGSILKYVVKAGASTGITITNITMKDITFSQTGKPAGSVYTPARGDLTFAEYYPDESQRVFLFEAEDALGNKAQIQRTVAITNAAKLESITTTTQDGTYGINTRIVLKANFSGQVTVTGTPKLKVRYMRNNAYYYEELNYSSADSSALSLGFPLTVAEGYGGKLETVYKGFDPALTDEEARPLILGTGATITDVVRNGPAFIPGYTIGNATMPNWTDENKEHLQSHKDIKLDGTRPVITNVAVSGKTAYSANVYYFKTGETISLTLSTGTNGKAIRSSATAPRLQYYIRENPNGNPQGTLQGPFNATGAFAYQRPDGTNALVFSLAVDANTNTQYDGELVQVSLFSNTGIEDEVGNPVTTASVDALLNLALSGTRIYIKRTLPAAPASTLQVGTGTAQPFTSAPDYYGATHPVLAIANSTATLAAWEDVKQYSLNGGNSWNNYTATVTIGAGTHKLRTRYVDRAGNDGNQASKDIEVKDTFPKLIAVTPVQPNGWVTSGGLDFKLDFEDQVSITTPADVFIKITNRGNQRYPGTTVQTYQATLTATSTAGLNSTVTLSLANVASPAKEMRDGLYVSEVSFTGLQDKFNNSGGTWSYSSTLSAPGAPPATGSITPLIDVNSSACPNLGNGLKVDAIAPSVSTYSPALGTNGAPAAEANGVATAVFNNATGTAGDYRNVITLTFREPVMKGNGTITIKPQKDFYVPPVFENNGYYLDQFTGTGNDIWARTEQKAASATSGRTTWIPGFYDIYNALPNTTAGNTQRNALTESTPATGSGGQDQAVSYNSYTPAPSSALDSTSPSMSRLRLDARTGQPVGPYVRTTHGLVTGAGYAGGYNNTTPAANGPAPAGSFMVPDTSTKWVLAFPYSINNADNVQYTNESDTKVTPANTVVTNIRAALVAAKFRWQEIDVISSNVVIDGSTVRITMPEPLLKGLQWELSYTAGTFTDLAGNEAGALAAETYVFWSPGAQKPVVRVDRKSYDGRTANWQRPRQNNDSVSFTYANPSNNNDWGITAFNTIAYRIETETPNATISYGTLGRSAAQNSTSTTGTGTAGPFYAVTGNYTGTVANTGGTGYTTPSDWNHAQTTNGQWLRPNLIRRGSAGSYTINGVTRTFAGTYRGIRSYNRDAELGNLTGVTSTGSANSRYRGTMAFTALEAGKAYVFATAGITNGDAYTSNMGYEGVFRTVIILPYANARTNTKILVEGSNIKNGMPSISGFPVQDAAESGDARFVKMMYSNTDSQFYWVSTEIVSEWYFLKFGGGRGNGNNGSHMSEGEVNNYLTVGYGDLTYAYDIISSSETR